MRRCFLFAIVVLFAACIKESSLGPDIPSTFPPTDSTGNPTNDQFIRMQAGAGLDTVYRFAYDDKQRLTLITDSGGIYGGTKRAVYNSKGNMVTLIEKWNLYPDDSTRYDYTYNAVNQLVQIDYFNESLSGRVEITYANGGPVKRTLSFSAGGVYKLFWTWNYTVKDGNITNIQQFDMDGLLYRETDYTFTDQENVFKALALFAHPDYGGVPLVDEGNLDMYFNKNLIASSNTSGNFTDYFYTYNDKKQLTQVLIATLEGLDEGIFVRTFSY